MKGSKGKHRVGKRSPSKSKSAHHAWHGYFRCDDLVPPICDEDLKVTTGTVETLQGIQVTYWRYTPSTLNPTKFPIVVINGGPGLPHNQDKPTRNFACDGREIVLYDQAGTGMSQLSPEDTENAPTLYPELFTIEYYAETELPALLTELGFHRYHILAESWGTMVAFQFAVSHVKNVRTELQSLILNAPIADNTKFIEYQWDPVDGTVGSFPTFTQRRLKHFNKTRNFDNEEFRDLEGAYFDEFGARLGVGVDCWNEVEEAGISTLDLERMTGATDLFFPDADVTLSGWTVLPHLYKVSHIPVQLNYGKFDFVRPHLIADTAQALQGEMVECHLFPRAAHSVLLDSPEEVYPEILDFLNRVESAADASVAFLGKGICPAPELFQDYGNDREARDGWHGQRAVLEPLAWMFAFLATFYAGILIGNRQKLRKLGYEQVSSS